MAVEVIAVLVAFGVAYALLRLYPEVTKTWFRRVMRTRQIIGGVVILILALIFIGSGATPLVVAGFVILLYAALFFLLERPHATIVSAVRRALGR